MLSLSMNIMLFYNGNAYVLFGTYLEYSEIDIMNWHRVAILTIVLLMVIYNKILMYPLYY